MKFILTLIAIAFLCGCASTPPPIEWTVQETNPCDCAERAARELSRLCDEAFENYQRAVTKDEKEYWAGRHSELVVKVGSARTQLVESILTGRCP